MNADDSRPGLMDGWLRAVVLVVVVAGSFVEVSLPHRQYGLLVDLFALAAVGVVGASAVLGSEAAETLARQRERLEQQPQPQPPSSAEAPVCRFVNGPAVQQPRPQPPKPKPFLRERPTDLSVPRFGEGARAQGYPWQLPERTVQNGIAADEATVGAFTIRAASVIGPGHRCAQPAEPRQDSYRIGRSRDSRYAIVAVADGVSSAAWSDVGSTTASSRAVTLLRERIDAVGFDKLDAEEVFGRIAESVAGQAAARGVDSSQVSTVLITAVVAEPDANGVAEAWIGWLGDSSAWLLDPQRPLWLFSSGEAKDRAAAVVSNEVAGRLPDTAHLARGHYVRLAPGAALALVTDGIGDAWADQEGNVNAYFANAWRAPVPATRFTADVGFDAPQCLDDRTAVVVWNGGRS
ncbi:protein phosphatase 2C domain-containing protein [Streptacidiphilus fuscans]|uniref:Protein phosphatase 2C domain-containing protein n=1 Tax=Streptacidiphilus fuscans TaxID=2789292 RepID=A0A931FB78_9ACTN|nr:protein phosphatase 2C domain-containing protein [Streptacidiphilus fuscans]MBF9068402.1 protein phosphatase 2C domain-containing protein [Streptacidiphilus fuscans]